MGPQSPLGLLHADGGYALLLGVGYTSNTFHHVVEMSQKVPCLGQRTQEYPVVLPDGRRVRGRTWGWRARNCPFNDNGSYGDVMEARGLHQAGWIGKCRALLFRLNDCYTVIAEILERGKDGFPPCSACPIRPAVDDYTVLSDWDATVQRPYAWSAAWEY